MKVKNALANNIEVAGDGRASLDMICKKLLANKSILAWILKSCVEEYKDCDIREIEENYIEGIPIIAGVTLHQDETAKGADFVKGVRNEENSMTEGCVTYDIKFESIRPWKKKTLYTGTSMIINVEAQMDYYPGYPLPKRGIYYGSRMISAQYGTVFTKSHYEKIQKVYSIWICINPPKYRKNSINLYSFREKCLLGNITEKEENYDLMTIVMICLADAEDNSTKGIIRLLSVLFSTEKSADEKREVLEMEFGIEMTQTMEEEAEEMCNYSKYVEEKGIEKGIEKGETRLASLLECLYADGRTEDVRAVLKDEMERKRLYREYSLI